jgi:hypothetical protein
MSNSKTVSGDETERTVCLAAMLKCDAEIAEKIMTICSVATPEQLYAKYIAVGKADALFAAALNIASEDWTAMMDRLRSALPKDVVERLETPLPLDTMPVTGYRPRTMRDSDKESATAGESDIEDEHDITGQIESSRQTGCESETDDENDTNYDSVLEQDGEKC